MKFHRYERSFFIRLAVATAALTAASAALASDLKSPFDLETTKVLPKGVRNPRFKNLFMSVDTKYNGIGQGEPLGQKLNKLISWQDLKDAQKLPEDKTLIDGLIADANAVNPGSIDPVNGSPGATTGQVNTLANVKVPVFAIGITDRYTLAVAVPIMNVDVATAVGFAKSNQGQAFVDTACDGGSAFKCNEAIRKLNDAVNQKLTRLGYEPIANKTVSGVGDIKVVNKVLVKDDGVDSVAVKGEVTLPTGTAPNADIALDIPTGDGQWDIGAAVVWDHNFDGTIFGRDLRFNAFGGYTAQLPDHLVKRLPTSNTDSLSADKELVRRNLGDIISGGTSVSYTFPSVGVTVGTGYNFQYMTKTTYDNGAFQEFRYRLLENEYPYQALHSATVMTGFSTVEWFKEKKFVYPFQANLSYSHPLIGRNVTKNDVVQAELVLFF